MSAPKLLGPAARRARCADPMMRPSRVCLALVARGRLGVGPLLVRPAATRMDASRQWSSWLSVGAQAEHLAELAAGAHTQAGVGARPGRRLQFAARENLHKLGATHTGAGHNYRLIASHTRALLTQFALDSDCAPYAHTHTHVAL